MTRNNAEMQAYETKTESKYIRYTDCTIFKHSMTQLQMLKEGGLNDKGLKEKGKTE